MSRYITAHDQSYQAFSRASIKSNKHWGEKVWVRGNTQSRTITTLRAVCEVYYHTLVSILTCEEV